MITPVGKTAETVTGHTDWAALREMPDAEIERIASEDRDKPASDEARWADATLAAPPGKTSIHARFDRDVVACFKRDGRCSRTRMDAVLRRSMETHRREETDRA